jgi:RNA polymerase sigma-70 factor (ECF subfamily)
MPRSRDFVTGRTGSLHEASMAPALDCEQSRAEPIEVSGCSPTASIDDQVVELYDQYFDFVWRSLCRLGVVSADLEDAAQDVFVVVHRRLASFEQRASIKSWIFGIALRVAKLYRFRNARQRARVEADETLLVCKHGNPEEMRAQMQAAEQVQLLLDELDDDKRAVFVLAELEGMPAPEIAQALGLPTNTVYSRLRLARVAFENALKRLKAKDDWRYQ